MSERQRSGSDMDSVDEAPQKKSKSSVRDWSYDGMAEHASISSKTGSICSANGPVDDDDVVSTDSQPMVSRKSYHDRSYLCTYGCDLRLYIPSFRCSSIE